MNVYLPPELEQLVQDKIISGRYNSISEVFCAALRLLEEREQIRAEVRAKVAAMESSRQGRMIDGDAFFDQMEAEMDEEARVEAEQAALHAVRTK